MVATPCHRAVLLVSDLHLTDRDGGHPITPEHFAAFVRDEVEPRAAAEPLDVVFLGDTVDVLRSPVWSDPGLKVLPWSQAGIRFADFPTCAQATLIAQILDRVEQRYRLGLEHLRQLVAARRVATHYVVGNHDFTLSLAPALREQVSSLFGVEGDARALPAVYQSAPLGLLARHGHQSDPYNLHDREASRWAIGDAIVLSLVNGVSRRFRDATGQGPEHRTVGLLDELDNVEPNLLVPEYLRALLEFEIAAPDRRRVEAAWEASVLELEARLAAEPGLWSSDGVSGFVRALPALRDIGSGAALATIAALLDGLRGSADLEDASRILSRSPELCLVVTGHTHCPSVTPVAAPTRDRRLHHLNTGAWRTVVRPAEERPRGRARRFVTSRLSSLAVVRRDVAQARTTFEHVVRWNG